MVLHINRETGICQRPPIDTLKHWKLSTINTRAHVTHYASVNAPLWQTNGPTHLHTAPTHSMRVIKMHNA